MSKVIAVIGATGNQGSGLVKAILKHNSFKLRALTRNPSSEKAQAIKAQGAEVAAFDWEKPETFKDAFQGAYGLYVVTELWTEKSRAQEVETVRRAVTVAEEAGVSHFIYSTLENTIPFFDSVTEDRPPYVAEDMYVPHFDKKFATNSVFPKEKTTFLYTSFYLENYYGFGMISNGVLTLPLRDTVNSVIGVEDIGKCAYGIFEGGLQGKYMGESIYIAGDNLTCNEAMKILTEVTGKEFTYNPISRETYAGFGFPGADDLANMFDYYSRDSSFAEKRNTDEVRKLNPELKDLKAWAIEHKDILIEKCSKKD